MNMHVDPLPNVLRAQRRYVPANTPRERDRLDAAACKLTAELIQAGAERSTFYFTIGAGELHLYSPREVMLLAQAQGLRCDFVVDWHELKSNIADVNPRHPQRPRSEPASVLSPTDAGSTNSKAEEMA